jgi:hypothetical protein
MAVPTREQLQAGWDYEAARRPLAEKVCAQYQRGLITLWELIAELTEVDVIVERQQNEALTHAQRMAEAERMHAQGWTLEGAMAHLEGLCDHTVCTAH